ncbi:hypothetical protein M422DRAFT_261235 [Sphaerobolus stellatus SS14]|uniref:Unplaced genomic scaffold SPHSTscaffold_103, whole genome shotgun sequence n=1 Tax=Sphaerobolus stellatus (strain SS14) TaxID=990650 RepID=A0A0C9VFW3_SPHS4|nr:hypothetical protein M422DRAFT_261232 [Sphaerobolus stellatus SS14]KIJ36475.1 hypothetical protein M422DRAFT_261235 [Sphaerobolus stellatus SS14]
MSLQLYGGLLLTILRWGQQPEPRTSKHSRSLADSSSPNGPGAQDPSEGGDVNYANSDHPPKCHRNESRGSTPPPSTPPPQSRALIITMEASFTVFLPDIPADQRTLNSGPSNSNKPPRCKGTTQAEMYLAANHVQISKKVWVDGVINVTEAMESWPISNDSKTYTYIVDFSGSKLNLRIQLERTSITVGISYCSHND